MENSQSFATRHTLKGRLMLFDRDVFEKRLSAVGNARQAIGHFESRRLKAFAYRPLPLIHTFYTAT